jgi:hypothetical protein
MEEISNKARANKMYKMGYKFSLRKKLVYKRFDQLEELTNKKYTPLYLVFGIFIKNCCQNRDYAQKILSMYFRNSHCKNNLNNIFGDRAHNIDELAIVYAGAAKDNFHKIMYSSSNIKRLIGKHLGKIFKSHF